MRRLGRLLLDWYPVLVVLAAWQLLSVSGLVSPRMTPGLAAIAEAMLRALKQGDLWVDISVTVLRAAAGFAIAIVAGFTLGIAMARSRWAEDLLEPIFSFSYPIPRIALYPIFILVFGLGDASKIALVGLECLFPITLYVFQGIRSVETVLVWAARSMGANGSQLFWRVLLPAAAPSIFAGIRIAMPIALIIVISTELIGESIGLGFFVSYAAASYDYPRLMAGLVAVAAIGFVLDRTLIFLRRRLVFWQQDVAAIG